VILAMFSKAPFEWCWASACQWHRAGKPPELLCSRVPLAEDFGLEVWDHFRLSWLLTGNVSCGPRYAPRLDVVAPGCPSGSFCMNLIGHIR